MNKNEYIVGIIGGMGSYATADFFLRLIQAFPAEKEWERPRILIDNYCTMPSRVRAILYNERREELVRDLADTTKRFLQVGVSRIILACNTSHVFLPEIINIVPESADRFINIIDVCGQTICEKGMRSVSLMASEGTIETKIYQDTFGKYGIQVNVPVPEQFQRLRMLIEAVKQNKVTESVCRDFIQFQNSFADEGVILGCTELPILAAACVRLRICSEKVLLDPLQTAIEQIVTEYEACV